MDSVFLVFSVARREGGWCWCSFVVDDVGVARTGSVNSVQWSKKESTWVWCSIAFAGVGEAGAISIMGVLENTGLSLFPSFPLGDSPPPSLESVIRVVNVTIRGAGEARVNWLVGVR